MVKSSSKPFRLQVITEDDNIYTHNKVRWWEWRGHQIIIQEEGNADTHYYSAYNVTRVIESLN